MIAFDPEKDAVNIAKHGVSLRMANRIALDDAIIVTDERKDYGEVRYNAFAEIDGRMLAFSIHLSRQDHPGTQLEALPHERISQSFSYRRSRRVLTMNVSDDEYFASLDEDDAPELTDALIARAKRGRDILPEHILAQFPRSRGRPKSESPKRQITLRLDGDLIDFFKAGGDGWQSRMNNMLRKGAGLAD